MNGLRTIPIEFAGNEAVKTHLVDAKQLRDLLFAPESGPHVETVKLWGRTRKIPSVKLGRLVFFDPEQVRAAISERHTIKKRAA